MEPPKELHTWLEKLQQESWNLELLVSGFSIFLLVQAKGELLWLLDYLDLVYNFSHSFRNVSFLFVGIGILGTYALIISLVFHIFLRGFWIGAIGLRSVQPKVDFERLRYTTRFEDLLKDKLPTLDRMLIRLDQVASAVFSFAFLAVFMLVSLAIWFVFLTITILIAEKFLLLFSEESFWYQFFEWFLTILILGMIFTSVLYLIDTLSIGLLKRIRWFSKIYHRIYRFWSTITLSFFYRSIYYHLVSYIGVWRSRLLFNGFLFSMLLFPYFRVPHDIFFPDDSSDNEMTNHHYDDLRSDEEAIWDATIPSSVIAENNLPLFIRYSPQSNNTLLHLCDYQPTKEQRLMTGIGFEGGALNLEDPYFEEASPDSLLICLTELYEVQLNDSTYQDLDYYFLEHSNQGELGIYTVLNIADLEPGAHELRIKYQVWREFQDTIVWRDWAMIPFWKEY